MGYLIIELAGQWGGNGVACTEIVAEGATLSVPEAAHFASNAFDSYWWNRTGTWSRERLVDGNITYLDDGNGGASSAYWSGTAGWDIDKWLRFAVPTSGIPSKVTVYLGNPDNRIPKQISVYYTDDLDVSEHLTNRGDSGLLMLHPGVLSPYATLTSVTPFDFYIPERLYRNWNVTGSSPWSTNATMYDFANLPPFEVDSVTVTAAGFKIPTSSNVTSASLIIYSFVDLRVHYISPPIPVVTDPGGFKLFEIDGLDVRMPYHFGIGLRALSGNNLTGFNSGFDVSGETVGRVYSNRPNEGGTLIIFGGGTTMSWGSYVDVVWDTDSLNFSGIELDLTDSAQLSSSSSGYEIEAAKLGTVNRAPLVGAFLSDVEPGERLSRGWIGTDLSEIELGERYSISSGSLVDDVELGILSSNYSGIFIDEPLIADIFPNNLQGYSLDDITPTSNAEYRFNLLVTPTHQYRNQIVSIEATNSQGFPLMGRYQLEIGPNVIIPYGSTDIDLRNISFSVMPSQLETGNNFCRLYYLYPDESREYLDFEIFKEEPRRIAVERTFRSYDGGYDGDRNILIMPDMSTCFGVPNNQNSTIIRTTDYTSIPLARYTSLQSVFVESAGARLLVSFNKGLTWKAFTDNIWQTVLLDNISTQGMTKEVINSITMARWSEIFTPTSLDFVIYLDVSLSEFPHKMYSELMGMGYIPDGYVMSMGEYARYANRGWSGSITEMDKDGNVLYSLGAFYNGGSTETRRDTHIIEDNAVNKPRQVVSSGNAGGTLTIHPVIAFVKSINVQITPRLKTGYAFIM